MWVSLMIMVKLLMMVVVLMVMFSNMGMNLMSMAFVSLKGMQLSVGPQTVGVWMVLQSFADAVKLLIKESILPNHANMIIFLLAPIFSLVLIMLVMLADMNMGMLYLFAVSSLGAYAVLCSGWASNSSYDLVSGFHTEYSAILFFLSEYGNVILMSYFNVLFLFIWTRASLPSMRFDNIMHLGWKSFLSLAPLSLISQ